MKKIFSLVVINLLILKVLQAQTLQKTHFEQKGSEVYIYFEMSGVNDNQQFDVALECSEDGGNNFSIKPKTLTGDIGKAIKLQNGKNTIIWTVLSDRNKFGGDKFVFKVSVNPLFTGPEMVFVKGGKFMMGSEDGEDDEKPIHEVELSDFYIGKYEVTVSEFEKFISETKYQTDADKSGHSIVYENGSWITKNDVNWKCDVAGNLRAQSDYKHPVIHVSWNDANEYCNWLSKKTDKKYSLPSEAQWEYAAGGGATAMLSNRMEWAGTNKENELKDYAWYSSNSDSQTHEVGTRKPNSLEIYDMSGNVFEWCADWYDQNYYITSPNQNPENLAKNSCKVLRGGSWDYNCGYSRVAFRVFIYPSVRNGSGGFRLVSSF